MDSGQLFPLVWRLHARLIVSWLYNYNAYKYDTFHFFMQFLSKTGKKHFPANFKWVSCLFKAMVVCATHGGMHCACCVFLPSVNIDAKVEQKVHLYVIKMLDYCQLKQTEQNEDLTAGQNQNTHQLRLVKCSHIWKRELDMSALMKKVEVDWRKYLQSSFHILSLCSLLSCKPVCQLGFELYSFLPPHLKL